MKILSESEAQKLADLTGKIVTLNRYGEVVLFSHCPIPKGSCWHKQKSTHRSEQLYIGIDFKMDSQEYWFLAKWMPSGMEYIVEHN